MRNCLLVFKREKGKNFTNSLQENGQIRILKADLLKQKALKLVEDSVKIKEKTETKLKKRNLR
ncbi:MAG: hypothetical protein Ct9H90mP11_06670 [Acidimicrobiales bacterium]|nr:MAG: hypothetical protein Ct9H90mP11_06670 [Acidimicrobiales bacterium]